MYSLPVRLLLPVKDCIFVLWQHLLLSRHLLIPPLHGLVRGPEISLQCSRYGIYDAVNCTQTLSLAAFLVTGDSPWGFPVGVRKKLAVLR
jgi:hypothetical protein